MPATDTTIRLLDELESIDKREDRILAALLERLEALERRELRTRSVRVADLQALQTALDEVRAKLSAAQAAAEAPPAAAANGDGAPVPVAPPTFAQLAAQIRDQDASARQVREIIAERLHALTGAADEGDRLRELAPAGTADAGDRVRERAEHDIDAMPARPRTLRLERPLMQGPEVRAFQRLLNRRFAGWGVDRQIAEHGRYGPETKEAAHQVALGLGLLAADLEHGITPLVRTVIRTPSRRTERQQRRAGERAPYRAALRTRYAGRSTADGAARSGTPQTPHTPQTSPTQTQQRNGNGRTAVAGGVAAAIRSHGGHYEDAIVRAATRFGVPVALVCAVADVESGFTNVFGHDTVRNPIKSPPPPAPDRVVTEALYREYKRHRKLGEGSQGVGPMQLTFFTLQDEADALGGCFDPAINIHVGVRQLGSLIAAHGLRDGVQRYNGARGHGYADRVLKRRALWEQRLAGASPGPPTRPGPSRTPGRRTSGRPVAPTYRVREPAMRGPAARRLQRDINRRFASWGIGRHVAEDGVYGADTQRAARQALIALGVAASAYADGVTPRLRVVIRTPSRRTAGELRRSKERAGYRSRLRTRYGAAAQAIDGHPVAVKGSPKAVIDTIVVPIARRHAIDVTAASVAAANAAHSVLTTSGNRSDHKGPPNVSWAADMSNGSAPTPQMDRLAADLAAAFGIPWSGSGLVSHNAGGYRYQLIYRTNQGGNHFNHVHLGVKKL